MTGTERDCNMKQQQHELLHLAKARHNWMLQILSKKVPACMCVLAAQNPLHVEREGGGGGGGGGGEGANVDDMHGRLSH